MQTCLGQNGLAQIAMMIGLMYYCHYFINSSYLGAPNRGQAPHIVIALAPLLQKTPIKELCFLQIRTKYMHLALNSNYSTSILILVRSSFHTAANVFFYVSSFITRSGASLTHRHGTVSS